MSGYSPTNHNHKVTINGTVHTITGSTAIDLGTYATSDYVTSAISSFTYNKTEIDKKIKDVTVSSLGIATLTNTEIDTMFTQIFG